MTLLSVFLFSADIYANLNGTWIQHPAAALRSGNKESQVDRIIEGERYVYFSVRGGYLNRSTQHIYSTIKNIDLLQIFRYDKGTEWCEENIKPLAQEFELSGSEPSIMNYSDGLGVFAVAYNNNAVDFIYDDGTLITSKALKEPGINGMLAIYSITFDEERERAYVAGKGGFAVINIRNGEVEKYHHLDKPVSWAGRVGDNIVVFAGSVSPSAYATETYIFAEDDVPQTLGTPVTGASNLQALMPLSSNTFAALARGSADTASILRLYTIREDRVISEDLISTLTVDNASSANFRHLFRTDGFALPAKGGYAVYDKTNIILLKKNAERDRLMTGIPKNSLGTNEQASKCSTFDGSRLWLYYYENTGANNLNPRGFYSYDIVDGKFSGKTAVTAPSAPLCTYTTFGEWNPKYGLLVRGPGTKFDSQEPDLDRLAAYKDGKWTDLTFGANSTKYTTPGNYVRYINSDPLNPDWIWGCNNRWGLLRTDASDFTNFFMLGTDNKKTYQSTYPGYFPIYASQANWNIILSFTNVDFDSEDRMWFVRMYYHPADAYYDYEEVTGLYTPIYYLTKEERQQIANIGNDQSKLPDILGRELRIPRVMLRETSQLIALKHEANRNILAVSPQSSGDKMISPFLYDHNGTPDDPSDDRYVAMREFFDEKGDMLFFMTNDGLYEDEKTGELWILTSMGPFIINPKEYLDGNHTAKRVNISKRYGESTDGNHLEMISILNMDTDIFGRKWLATQEGLLCLSPENDEILGEYNISNSSLPSNEVFDVVCNPETGAIFALTGSGLAEFRPEGSFAEKPAGRHLTVWPAAVTPDYKGYVNISGADNGSEYAVYDSEGNKVSVLGRSDSGLLQWDVKNTTGKRVSAGRYEIKRTNKDESHIVVVLD